jgi:polysaccharide chain length determinant protein (PEP-CTERM system associated)
MIENRELTMDDYLAMLRRRLKIILIPALLAPIVGFAVSFAFSPKFTSQSTILIEPQKVPEGYVASVVTSDLSNRIATLEQRALSAERLRPLIENLKLAQGNAAESKIDEIRLSLSIDPVQSVSIEPNGGPKRRNEGDVPGFLLKYTANNAREAQAICAGVSDIMIRENLTDRAQVAQNTTDFLGRQVEEDKRKLDEQDSKLADFKKRFMGQMPVDADTNMKYLMGLNSQLDANTQTLNRAQQDKAYAESMLAQQVAAWKSAQNTSNPQTLQTQLSSLQSQLVTLQSRYTDDYPEVVKTKRDVAEVQKQLNDINNAPAATTAASDKGNLQEPPEIRQLRLQIHQLQDQITNSTRDQARIQESIKVFQGRVALSPAVEEQYKQLTRDNETLQKLYDDDLAKKRASEKQTAMELEQQGEQMRVLNPADLPSSPSFPNRWLFAGGGFAGGLAIGLGLAFWLEFRDTLVRTEQDVLAILELPVLAQVPWVGVDPNEKGGSGKQKERKQPREEKKETVEV